jgi:hypothetical protein
MKGENGASPQPFPNESIQKLLKTKTSAIKQRPLFKVISNTLKDTIMPLPENPNLDESQDEKDPGNEYEQNEGQDTGNQKLDGDVADIAALNAATRASESAFTLNVDDGIADKKKD